MNISVLIGLYAIALLTIMKGYFEGNHIVVSIGLLITIIIILLSIIINHLDLLLKSK
jgi:hypothetical protein